MVPRCTTRISALVSSPRSPPFSEKKSLWSSLHRSSRNLLNLKSINLSGTVNETRGKHRDTKKSFHAAYVLFCEISFVGTNCGSDFDRRKRRQTRGRRGVILPDREPSKTKRTLLHHGHLSEPMDATMDPQNDIANYNRAGPTTRRGANSNLGQDHSYSHLPVGPNGSGTMNNHMAIQGPASHHRLPRKLRGTGSDLSAHHLSFPGNVTGGGIGVGGGGGGGMGINGGGPSVSFSRDLHHGSKEKLMASSQNQHMHSPMRETTPVFTSKEGE